MLAAARATLRIRPVVRRSTSSVSRVMSSAVQEAAAPKEVFRSDYAPPPYTATDVDLTFLLNEEQTEVLAETKMKPVAAAGELELAGGPDVVLKSVLVDGAALPATSYERTPKGGLALKGLPTTAFTLSITTIIEPQNNTSLDGLYKSSGNFTTQCEAEGFRNITFFLDRPDVMPVWSTRMEADKAKYPVLLGNGNLEASGDLENGRHFALWRDPWPKPCYLFALVAGTLSKIEDTFTTMSGREVALRIFVQAHNIDRAEHAMRSLKMSMEWDEKTFGLEYDLDLFNIVAVDDFNMGAMENKSLNIFNSRCVLASPATASDADFGFIEAVVAHEYFHNWTGNRVTCRDWFQLSLKEGLTVYRDQEFTSDVNSRGVKRIDDVSRLRSSQFKEDAGPMAHPVRPDSYIKMDNFYTVTVYEKGAEVVRMYETLLGRDGFRKGMDLYFKRHDGQAVTCDDFFAAMSDANSDALDGFKLWYSQAGTPHLKMSTEYDSAAKTFTLKCKQTVPATPKQDVKQPVLIPIRVGLLGADGKDMPLTVRGDSKADGTSVVLRMTEEEQTYVFENVAEKPVPSILRAFSAPVRLESDVTEDDLIFLLANDSDPYNRWEAGQGLMRALLLSLAAKSAAGQALEMDARIIDALRSVLADGGADKSFVARVLSMPSESELAELMDVADPDAIHAASQFVKSSVAAALRSELEAAVAGNSSDVFSLEKTKRAERTLKNVCLGYLGTLEEETVADECLRRYRAADNMTDMLAAISSMNGWKNAQRDTAVAEFYEKFKDDNLVMNKWLSIQAISSVPGNVDKVRELLEHPAFEITNPNNCSSLLSVFAACPVNFHAKDGSGYKLLGEMAVKIDKINPQVAARMCGAFLRWKKYDAERGALMKAQLEAIVAAKPSENLFEIASKALL